MPPTLNTLVLHLKMNKWANKSVLITGGAGLIGSALARNLVTVGAQVIVIDDLSRGNLEFLADALPNISLQTFDLRDYQRCKEAIRGVDVVVHMASRVGGIKVYTNEAFSIMNDNILIDSNVLRAALHNGIKNFFYASSAHVYPISMQNTIEGQKMTESNAYPADPLLSYGWAKLIMEKQLEYAADEFKDFSVAVARYIGIYGPNQDYGLQTGSVIPVFSHRAIKYPEISFSVWGDGEETRSYCFIDDAVDCTKMMIEKMDIQQMVGPYNVGSSDIIKIKEIAQKVVEISQKDITLEFDTSQKAKILSQWCDCQKIYEDLGWKPQTSFDDGLKIVYNDIQRRIKQ